MSKLSIARRKGRRGLVIPLGGTRASPSLLFPLDGVERSELEDLVRAILAKQKITEEPVVQGVLAKAELDSEVRMKIYEVRMELRRLMALKRGGAKLMQLGFRRWKEVFYPATNTTYEPKGLKGGIT